MLNFKSNLMMILVLFALSLACAPARTAKSKDVTQDSNTGGNSLAQQHSGSAEIVRNPASGGSKEGMNILAEGSYGRVGEPFVAVTRDPQIYSALRSVVRELPELGDDFFKSNSVVAVFPGQRNTGGYSVEVARSGEGQIIVSERVPPPDAITTQAITKPFKVVSVPTKEDEDVTLILPGGWAASLLRPYRVSGEFVSAGAARGRAEKLRLEGGLGVARYGGLATVFFDLKGAGAKGPSASRAVVTGVVDQSGRFSAASLNFKTPFGGLSNRLLRFTGRFTSGGDKLQLAFESSSPDAARGSSISGELVAVASGPAPAVTNPGESVY